MTRRVGVGRPAAGRARNALAQGLCSGRWLAGALAGVLSLAVGAQEPPRTTPVEGADPHQRGAAAGMEVFRERVLVKLREGSGAELVDGRLRSRSGWDLTPVQRYFESATAEPVFTALSWDELEQWQARAIRNLGPDRDHPGHLGLWFRLIAGDGEGGAELVRALAQQPLVEFVYQEPVPYVQSTDAGRLTYAKDVSSGAGVLALQNPQDPPPPTPDMRSMQSYMEAAPVGLGSYVLQGVLGGRGRGVIIGQCESDWIVGHEDISEIDPANFVGGLPLGTTAARNHGTAGASLVTGDRNGWGLTGLADLADMRYLIWDNFGVANSMLAAAANIQPGDGILVILSYLLGQTGPNDFVPIEFVQADYQAILTVTGNGYHLLENAGNGASNLDDPRYLRRFDLSYRDSGAIVVGASDDLQPIGRASFSNYGSRVDCCGQGLNCLAAGYGTWFRAPGTATQSYTERYQGTSSATGMLAGAVAQLIGATRFQLGREATTAELRQWLRSHGEPVGGNIGVRPDLVAIAEAAGIIDGLRVDTPEAAPGGTFELQMQGPAGSLCFLYLGFAVDVQPSGLNRSLHIGAQGLDAHGAWVLAGGVATDLVTVPANLAARGVEVLFQGLRIDGPGALHVTNSVQVYIE